MRSLLVAVAILLMTAGTASAHGRFSFGVNLGFPLVYPYSYPAYSYPVAPVYHYPYPERRVYHVPSGSTRVVDRYYVNGRLVEKRVKIYNGYGHYPGPRY